MGGPALDNAAIGSPLPLFSNASASRAPAYSPHDIRAAREIFENSKRFRGYTAPEQSALADAHTRFEAFQAYANSKFSDVSPFLNVLRRPSGDERRIWTTDLIQICKRLRHERVDNNRILAYLVDHLNREWFEPRHVHIFYHHTPSEDEGLGRALRLGILPLQNGSFDIRGHRVPSLYIDVTKPEPIDYLAAYNAVGDAAENFTLNIILKRIVELDKQADETGGAERRAEDPDIEMKATYEVMLEFHKELRRTYGDAYADVVLADVETEELGHASGYHQIMDARQQTMSPFNAVEWAVMVIRHLMHPAGPLRTLVLKLMRQDPDNEWTPYFAGSAFDELRAKLIRAALGPDPMLVIKDCLKFIAMPATSKPHRDAAKLLLYFLAVELPRADKPPFGRNQLDAMDDQDWALLGLSLGHQPREQIRVAIKNVIFPREFNGPFDEAPFAAMNAEGHLRFRTALGNSGHEVARGALFEGAIDIDSRPAPAPLGLTPFIGWWYQKARRAEQLNPKMAMPADDVLLFAGMFEESLIRLPIQHLMLPLALSRVFGDLSPPVGALCSIVLYAILFATILHPKVFVGDELTPQWRILSSDGLRARGQLFVLALCLGVVTLLPIWAAYPIIGIGHAFYSQWARRHGYALGVMNVGDDRTSLRMRGLSDDLVAIARHLAAGHAKGETISESVGPIVNERISQLFTDRAKEEAPLTGVENEQLARQVERRFQDLAARREIPAALLGRMAQYLTRWIGRPVSVGTLRTIYVVARAQDANNVDDLIRSQPSAAFVIFADESDEKIYAKRFDDKRVAVRFRKDLLTGGGTIGIRPVEAAFAGLAGEAGADPSNAGGSLLVYSEDLAFDGELADPRSALARMSYTPLEDFKRWIARAIPELRRLPVSMMIRIAADGSKDA